MHHKSQKQLYETYNYEVADAYEVGEDVWICESARAAIDGEVEAAEVVAEVAAVVVGVMVAKTGRKGEKKKKGKSFVYVEK